MGRAEAFSPNYNRCAGNYPEKGHHSLFDTRFKLKGQVQGF